MKSYVLSIGMILCTSLQSAESIVKTYDENLAEQRITTALIGAWATVKKCLDQPSPADSDSYAPRYHKLFTSSDLVSLQDTLLREGDLIYTQPVPDLKKCKSYLHCDISGGTGIEERIQEKNHMLYRLCPGTVHTYSFYQKYEDNMFHQPIVEFFEHNVIPASNQEVSEE